MLTATAARSARLERAETIATSVADMLAAMQLPPDDGIDPAQTPIVGLPVQSLRVLVAVVADFKAERLVFTGGVDPMAFSLLREQLRAELIDAMGRKLAALSDELAVLARQSQAVKGIIREAFEEGFALSKLNGPIADAWDRSEARQQVRS